MTVCPLGGATFQSRNSLRPQSRMEARSRREFRTWKTIETRLRRTLKKRDNPPLVTLHCGGSAASGMRLPAALFRNLAPRCRRHLACGAPKSACAASAFNPFCQCLANFPDFCQALANPPAARERHFANVWQNRPFFAKYWQTAMQQRSRPGAAAAIRVRMGFTGFVKGLQIPPKNHALPSSSGS